MEENSRITVLLGAGVPLDLKSTNGFRPTTGNITNEVLVSSDVSGQRQGKLLNMIYNKLCEDYHPSAIKPFDEDSPKKVHFEVLFYILEMLDTYERSWDKNTYPIYTNKFATFVTSRFTDIDYRDLFSAKSHIVETIIKSVRKYDDIFASPENEWYRNFWKKNQNGWDLFNLNYDTTVEQSLGNYEDGFEDVKEQQDFQRFNINKLLNNKKQLSTINHIHGCILYGYDRYKDVNHDVFDYDNQDLYKWQNKDEAYKIWNDTLSSSATSQDGSFLVQGPIITGLNKTDKVTCLPYDGYRNNLFKCIAKNRGLVVAGYSFGDPYINQMLCRILQSHGDKARVVLIDFWDLKYSDQTTTEGMVNNDLKDSDLRPIDFEHFFLCNMDKIETLLFIKRIVHHDMDVWSHFNKLSLTGPMISDNNMIMLFIGGFKKAIINYEKEIYDFLDKGC